MHMGGYHFVISATPYAAAPIVENPVTPDEEVPGASSATLDDWLNQPGPSTQGLNQLPPEYQQIVAEYNNLVEQDVHELAEVVAASVKDKIKGIWRQRRAEMMTKLGTLSNQSKGPSVSLNQVASDLPHQRRWFCKAIHYCRCNY